MYIKNFDDAILKTNLRAYVHADDLVKGKKYAKDKIVLLEEKDISNGNYYHFELDSITKNTFYEVSIYIGEDNNVLRALCDCNDFRIKRSCEHIGAVFFNYYDLFFAKVFANDLKISNNILEKFVPKVQGVKKELQVELVIDIVKSKTYYRNCNKFNVKVNVGTDKLYVLGNHTNQFKKAYESDSGIVIFGKNFTYDPTKHFVSKESADILYAYFLLMESNFERYPKDTEIKKFLGRIKNSGFIINNYQVDGIIEGFYINSKLDKVDDNYELSFDLENIEEIINDDYEYIIYKGKIYHLNKDGLDLINSLKENNLDKLLITKNNFNIFTKGMLGLIKNGLEIGANIENITIPKDILVQIYIDINTIYIDATIKFKYDGVEVNYFDNSTIVLRDIDFEKNVLNDLITKGFVVENNKIILTDIDKQVEFIENGLEELAQKYEIFTTEKYKNINIKRKTNISSMFKIGQDNILKYDFNLGNIDSDELLKIFADIKKHKKYYRLKDGNILSLEDKYLKELSDLSDDLELSDEDIIKGKGSILKYRALYLDSIKKTKYNIIATDNLFDQFINNFYKYKDVDINLSSKDLSILRDYQVVGVKWLKTLKMTGFGGILADEMGLGKTIQIIYYIKEMLKENDKLKFLIVAPTSLSYNWEHEFFVFGNEINRVVCTGSKDKRISILSNLDDQNVIITTYGVLREDEDLYKNLTFDTMVIDEAQNIKNNVAGITRCVKKIKANTKFALTGTPLENNILELWSIFDFIMPGFLSSLTKFQSKYKIKDMNQNTITLLENLTKEIKPFILRRRKADVIKELPEKLTNDIYIDLSEEQKKLYAAELEMVKKAMDEVINTGDMNKANFLILPLLTKLRQICIDPKIVYENYTGGSNKLDRLEEIVKEYINNNHKILIFSSFKTALNLVKERLLENDIKNYMIDGSVPGKLRVDMVDSFNQNDDVKVFLIMLKSGGTGLNLTSADVVIHLDLWWNPQAENQATDRAHRIGQKNIVEVIHLIMKGTIEEKILELQNKKRVLSDKLIDSEAMDQNILGSLTKEDIEHLLSYENKD